MVRDPSLRFVCIREIQKSLKYSAKSLVESKIEAMGVGHLFDVQVAEIRRRGGSGVMIFQGMQDHTADSIKSLEGFGRAWIEEAQSISERSLRLLRPTIRREGSELWFSWNPELATDPVDVFFAGRAGAANVAKVHTTYRDNPFCPAEMLEEAAADREASIELYDHVWGGGYFVGGSGRVYSNFRNRQSPEGSLDESLCDLGAEILVGMDFNVNPMSLVIGVRAADELHILDALEVPTSNTQEVAEELGRRYPGRTVIVCPDPSGKNRSTKTTIVGQTDFTILERAGFEVRAPKAAPLVVDRVNNVQELLHDPRTKRRRLLVHPKARALVKSLGHMTYKEGTSIPDKKKGLDHMADALGYLCWQEFNVLSDKSSVAFETVSM